MFDILVLGLFSLTLIGRGQAMDEPFTFQLGITLWLTAFFSAPSIWLIVLLRLDKIFKETEEVKK